MDYVLDVTTFKTKSAWGSDPYKDVPSKVKSSFTRCVRHSPRVISYDESFATFHITYDESFATCHKTYDESFATCHISYDESFATCHKTYDESFATCRISYDES